MAKLKKNELTEAILETLKEYSSAITLRQLFYRLVANETIENKISQYKRLSSLLVELRKNGTIPYDALEDRTRDPKDHVDKKNIDYDTDTDRFVVWYNGFIKSRIRGLFNIPLTYLYQRWYRQPNYVEVWVEKQSLQNIFNPICKKHKVVLVQCKGYPSHTVIHDAKERIYKVVEEWDKSIHILYFGDYDPSGLDIDKFIHRELKEDFGNIGFKRIALTLDYIQTNDIPHAMAKKKDPRSKTMKDEHGSAIQVELDGIKPPELTEIVNTSLNNLFDYDIHSNNLKEIKGFMLEAKEIMEEKYVPEYKSQLVKDFSEEKEDDQ